MLPQILRGLPTNAGHRHVFNRWPLGALQCRAVRQGAPSEDGSLGGVGPHRVARRPSLLRMLWNRGWARSRRRLCADLSRHDHLPPGFPCCSTCMARCSPIGSRCSSPSRRLSCTDRCDCTVRWVGRRGAGGGDGVGGGLGHPYRAGCQYWIVVSPQADLRDGQSRHGSGLCGAGRRRRGQAARPRLAPALDALRHGRPAQPSPRQAGAHGRVGAAAPLVLFGVVNLFALAGPVADLVSGGRVHPAYCWGVGAIVLMEVVMPPLAFAQLDDASETSLVELAAVARSAL
jgi:hypothetical protein